MGYCHISIIVLQIINFQFPLWDTIIIQLFEHKEKYFQFPLWDTCNRPFVIAKPIFVLSIPFMGYIQ